MSGLTENPCEWLTVIIMSAYTTRAFAVERKVVSVGVGRLALRSELVDW